MTAPTDEMNLCMSDEPIYEILRDVGNLGRDDLRLPLGGGGRL
jgi:hypothetical protein